ncbi:MAG: hypothetical protein JNK34_11155 [Tabrizicola sp.]|nr:hypothetical protein [Tabrizicola sp.]
MTARPGYWRTRAEDTIRKVMAALPPDVSLEDRRKAVDAAYPFGARSHLPYKVWLRARRKALIPFGHVPKGKLAPVESQLLLHLSPLDRAKAKSLKAGGAT